MKLKKIETFTCLCGCVSELCTKDSKFNQLVTSSDIIYLSLKIWFFLSLDSHDFSRRGGGWREREMGDVKEADDETDG